MIAGAILGIYMKGRSDGKDLAEDKSKDAVLNDVKINKEIRDEVSGLSDDALAGRLSNWTRQE